MNNSESELRSGFGARFHAARVAAGLSQAQLAKIGDMAQGHISMVEKGLRSGDKLAVGALFRMCKAMKVDMLELLTGVPVLRHSGLTEQERRIIAFYRKHPSMQSRIVSYFDGLDDGNKAAAA